MKAYTYNDRLVGVGNDQILGTDQGGGSTYTAGNGIDITNDVISVDDTVALVSALPTTELGKFTIQSNVSGGPIEVICPTDQAPDTVFYQINSVSGNAYAESYSNGVINYYYGETPADFNGNDDSILFTINDSISNIGAIYFYYTTAETGMGGPQLSPTPITSPSYTIQSGTYKVKAQYNQAGTSSPYGKYLQIMFNWRNYATDAAQSLQWAQEALSKITFFGVVRPDPTLGTVVDLNRYELGNTATTTSTSGYEQAVIYTDNTSKKQSVYMSYSMPSNWVANRNIAQGFEYGTNGNSPSNSNFGTKLYKAFKYTSSPRRYQFAYCTDWDEVNKVMTFVAYDNSGNAIEKWTLDYTTYSSNVWTTTPISSGGSSYTAGSGIDITNNVISVDDTVAMASAIPIVTGYIPYSASGVYLPNSKFEIDTNGHAYKVIIPEHIDTDTVTYPTDTQYIQWGQLVVDGDLSVHTGDTITLNNLDSRITTVEFNFYKNSTQWNVNNVQVTNNTATIISDRDYAYTGCTIFLYVDDVPEGYTTNSETLSITQTEITPAVKEEYLTDGDLELNGDNQVTAIDGHALAGNGGSTYTAGQYISIDSNDVISVTGLQVAGNYATTSDVSDMATKTWVGNQGYLTSVPEGYATDQELAEAVTAVTSIIPAAQVNSDWNANSGVAEILNKPTEIQLIAGTNVQIEVSGVSAVISAQGGGGGSSYTAGDFIDITNNVISVDDTSNVVAGDGINITQSGNNTTISLGVTAGITDIQLVNSLPASPTSTVLYLIPET